MAHFSRRRCNSVQLRLLRTIRCLRPCLALLWVKASADKFCDSSSIPCLKAEDCQLVVDLASCRSNVDHTFDFHGLRSFVTTLIGHQQELIADEGTALHSVYLRSKLPWRGSEKWRLWREQEWYVSPVSPSRLLDIAPVIRRILEAVFQIVMTESRRPIFSHPFRAVAFRRSLASWYGGSILILLHGNETRL